MAKISQKIDKLTNSIVNVVSGDSFDTIVIKAEKTELHVLKDWKFNWYKEYSQGNVVKLTIKDNSNIIQGLMSLVDGKDHIFMRLIENAPFNVGKSKIYEGVPGNLVAYACKLSFKYGYDGFVAFEPKTNLIEHYHKTLKAVKITNSRMAIDTNAAMFLMQKYYNK